ncbi:aldehyde dehydrogenase family protein [Streptomyces ferrugineus]|uniref:aldehyde dehydrogenase family protein n=1 Tax=Streptomyces ferrugineus TaxID=1413221 RepID=UPI001D141EDE|nr:aldehyde dehydrogenase family protein [Streptomyces ferrugineus]
MADAFTAAFVAGVEALWVGDSRGRDTQVGPLARDDLRVAIQRQVEESVAAGTRPLAGGKPLPGDGYPVCPVPVAVRLASLTATSPSTPPFSRARPGRDSRLSPGRTDHLGDRDRSLQEP